jgi:hypothetical protein
MKFAGKKIKSAHDLMKLILVYLQGFTLVEVSALSGSVIGSEISDVGFMKKFGKCGDWLKHLSEQLRGSSFCNYQAPAWLGNKKFIVIDATDTHLVYVNQA